MRLLSYGRFILNPSMPPVSFDNGEKETGLICLLGNGIVKTWGREFDLRRFDAISVPRGSSIEVSTKSSVDLAEFSALKFDRYTDLASDSGLRFTTGGPGSLRDVNLLLAKNGPAGRLLGGFTTSESGNWTSCPWRSSWEASRLSMSWPKERSTVKRSHGGIVNPPCK